MSVYTLASLNPQAQGQRPGDVATGHVPQQPNLGLGPNRYVPPTFNWGRGGLDGRQPNYSQMDWNQMQAFYMPQHTNNTFTNPYMQQLQGMLGNFSRQYGGPNRQPVMPQFGSYNPGFGGPTSFYDQSLQDWGRSAMGMQHNMGQGPQGQGEYQMYGGGGWGSGNFDIGGEELRNMSPEQRQQAYGDAMRRYQSMMAGAGQGGGGMQNPEGLVGNYGMSGDQIGGNSVNPIYANYRGGMGMGGGMQNPEGYSDRWSLAPSEMRGGNGGFMETIGGGGYPGGGFRGGFGGRGGYPMMPQFNPYMLARNNLGGMDFNQMFDPRFAMLFGMGGLGSLRPQGFAATQPQQPPSTANGQKPLAIGGGG